MTTMKHLIRLSLLTAVSLFFSQYSFAQSVVSEMFIVPVDADGNVAFDGSDFSEKIQMTANSDGSFSVSGCQISNGFYFLGQSDSAGTLYAISSWAVNPPVEIGPNPLSITTSSAKNYIKVTSSDYDIMFTPRTVSGAGMNTFTITPSSEAARYPDTIYLTSGTTSDKNIAVSGTDGVYTYTFDGNLSAFKISYEPSNTYATFIYGPVDASQVALHTGKKIAIERAANTGLSFSYTSDLSDASTDNPKTTLTVSLREGDQYVMVGNGEVTSIDSVEVDSSDAPFEIYTISGTKVGALQLSQLSPGLYIVKQGSDVKKIIIR